MDEHQIEIRAEKMMDRLDMRLLGGTLSQEEYALEVTKIQEWVDAQMKRRKR